MAWSKRPEKGCKINTAALNITEKQPLVIAGKLHLKNHISAL